MYFTVNNIFNELLALYAHCLILPY